MTKQIHIDIVNEGGSSGQWEMVVREFIEVTVSIGIVTVKEYF